MFKSNTNLFDTLQLFLADSTIAYDYNTGFGSQNKGCFANKSFATTKKDSSYYATFSITLNSVQDAYSTTQKRSAVIYFKDKYFNGQDLSDNGFLNFSLADGTNATPQTLMNYSLNGKIYPLAQSIFADSSSVKNSGVYKIIYAKNNGIIAYESSPGGVTWIKQ